jgi:hypothetical protein
VPFDRPDGVTIPTIWLAFALSLLIHVAVLWQWLPKLRLLSPDETKRGEANGSLVVRLAPPPSPSPSPKLPVQPPAPTLYPRPPIVAARPRPTPPVIALNRPASSIQSPPPTVSDVTAPAPARPPADGDLTSYIEARRRARAQSAPDASAQSVANAQPVEDDKARSNRIVAANLGMTMPSSPSLAGTRRSAATPSSRSRFGKATTATSALQSCAR